MQVVILSNLGGLLLFLYYRIHCALDLQIVCIHYIV